MNNFDTHPTGDDAACPYAKVLVGLTKKQHEVFELLAENRTSKEIAWRLGVTEGAITQRIEAVRSQTGFPPRADLARAYARLRASEAFAVVKEPEVTPVAFRPACTCGGRGASGLSATALPLSGFDNGLRRFAAMIAIAVGLLVAALVALSVAQTLSDFL